MAEEKDLFERMAELMGCSYVSDLRYLDRKEKLRLPGFRRRFVPVERRPGISYRRESEATGSGFRETRVGDKAEILRKLLNRS